jgi:hypothetical protein
MYVCTLGCANLVRCFLQTHFKQKLASFKQKLASDGLQEGCIEILNAMIELTAPVELLSLKMSKTAIAKFGQLFVCVCYLCD